MFGIGVANNGGGTDGMEYTLDSVSASSGDDILIVRSVDAMSAYFADCYGEFEIVLVGSVIFHKMVDDAIELFEGETVIETFGDIDVRWNRRTHGSTWIHGRIKLMEHGLMVM